MAADFNSLGRNEQGALVAGVAAVLLSFFPAFTQVTFDGPGRDSSTSAWSGLTTIGMLFLIGATVVVAFRAFARDALHPAVPWPLLAVVTAVFGTVVVVITALTAGSDGPGASVGPGWSGWLLLVAAILLSVFTVLMFRASDETVDVKDEAHEDDE